MLKRSHVLAIGMMAVGGLLGYAAASGQWNPFPNANVLAAANPEAEREPAATDAPPGGCCSSCVNKAVLLARADAREGRQQGAGQPVKTGKKPHVIIIWGDDVGQSNLSAYTDGLMGYRTPNIDRIGKEGLKFTDYYGEQSCTAGRASFITGQHGMRTGLTKVGLPGAPLGSRKEDPTIAELLKAHGYATGQFGKNHLGDRDEHLPTQHGFDEFSVTCTT